MAPSRRVQLLRLIKEGQLDSLRSELSDEPDEDWTAVAFAAVVHAPDFVQELLERGLPTDIENIGRTLLAEVCRAGATSLARDLLERGADPLKAHPLVLAASEGHEECVALLLEAGVPPDHSEPGRRTALGVARYKKHESIEARLIAAGANLEHLPPRTMTELFEQAKGGELERSRFDEELWERIAAQPHQLEDLAKLGEPILLAWAHRYFELQCGNGGLSQAVFNMRPWLPSVARAFETLGFPDHAALVERVFATKSTPGRPQRPTTFGKFMSLFKRSLNEDTFNELEKELERLGMFAGTEARIDYILQNREVFMAAEAQLFVPLRRRSRS